MNKIYQLEVLVNRLKKIGIDIECVGNYPWIYLDKINSKKVKETFKGNHGFTIGFLPASLNKSFQFTDLKHIFNTIRKYIN